jgi:hypothetical protein
MYIRFFSEHSGKASDVPVPTRGDSSMHRFLILSTFFFGATLIAPVQVRADDHREKRYYDREGRDYHTWNDQEDRAYHVYVGEQHRDYREFRRTKPAEQREYFRWRHEHPDHVLFKVEVK